MIIPENIYIYFYNDFLPIADKHNHEFYNTGGAVSHGTKVSFGKRLAKLTRMCDAAALDVHAVWYYLVNKN